MLIAHFAVPLAGAVLVALNTRLSADEVGYICRHSGARRLIVAEELLPSVPGADSLGDVGEVFVIPESDSDFSVGAADGDLPLRAYEELSGRGSLEPLPWTVDGRAERRLPINYTSGTTGEPKGVSIHPPRRVPERARRGDPLRAFGVVGVPLVAADVSLQRLVHHVGGDRDRWNARRSAGRPA